MRILLVEDEEGLRTALADTLAASRYAVDCCANGPDALDAVCTGGYDLVLLDRMLPGLDGLSVLRQARQVGVTTPVLLLTALDAVGDRVEGLDAGADDYLSKPFATEELLARIRALARRPAEWEQAEKLQKGDLTLEPQSRLLTGPAGSCSLSGRECALLELLLRNLGSTLPRERILLNVWGPDSEVESGNIDNYVHLVRRRLGLVGSRMTLVTKRGAGYCLEDTGMLTRLRRRIALLASLLTGGVLAAALLFSFFIAQKQYETSREAAFSQAVGQLQYQWERFDLLENSWLARLESQNGLWVQLAENGRPLLYSQRQSAEAAAALQAAETMARDSYRADPAVQPLAGVSEQSADFVFCCQGVRYRCAVRISGLADGGWRSLTAVQSLAAEGNYQARLAAVFLLVAAGCGGILSLVCWFVAGRAVAPVGHAMDQQQQFLSEAGHELRTPLAVIRANVGAAQSRPDKAAGYLRAIDGESRRMGQLVDELLLLSAGASARGRLRLEPLAPDTFLLDFVEGMEPLAAQRGRQLETRLPASALPLVWADGYRLRQLLGILLDNALDYALPDSAVELTLEARGGGVRFVVTDHGPGVADRDKKRIFERFVRAGQPRPEADGRQHYGLGLAVAKELASLHRGRLWVEDAFGGGAAFVLELPAAKSRPKG